MKSPVRKYLPWLLVLVIPLWMGAAIMETLDTRLLEREGVPVVGRMESPHWSATKNKGRRLRFDAVWTHEGREYRGEFSLPSEKGFQFMDKDGNIRETRLDMHYAPSKPSVASIDLQPPDPWWVGVIIGCVGLCLLCGVVWFLIREWRRPKK
ncbi:MAG: hypothetical protein ACO1TE_11115 [Prosthecobacter sp.]